MLSRQSLLHCSAHHQGSEHATHHDAQHLSMSTTRITPRHVVHDICQIWGRSNGRRPVFRHGWTWPTPVKTIKSQSSPKKIAAELAADIHIMWSMLHTFLSFLGVCCNLAARMSPIEANEKTIENCEDPFLRAPKRQRSSVEVHGIHARLMPVVPVVCSEVPDFAVPGVHRSYSISEHLRHRQEVTKIRHLYSHHQNPIKPMNHLSNLCIFHGFFQVLFSAYRRSNPFLRTAAGRNATVGGQRGTCELGCNGTWLHLALRKVAEKLRMF